MSLIILLTDTISRSTLNLKEKYILPSSSGPDLGFFIMKSLYFSYHGIIYLIFCDALFRFKENKYVKWLTIPLSLLLIISNYDFFSTLFPLVNADAYFEVYTSTTRGLLQVCVNFLDIINLLFFILFLMIYIANEV